MSDGAPLEMATLGEVLRVANAAGVIVFALGAVFSVLALPIWFLEGAASWHLMSNGAWIAGGVLVGIGLSLILATNAVAEFRERYVHVSELPDEAPEVSAE